MIRAYEETYLSDAMNNLGDMLDYAVNDCGYSLEPFYSDFIVSGVSGAFEKGNPKYVAGMSGPELASEVLYRTRGSRSSFPASEEIEKSPEYWTGWILAYYQWYTAHSFSYLQRRGLSSARVLSMYPTLHEADISKFVDAANHILEKSRITEGSNLKRIRTANGLTQKSLSDLSGVSLRMIQLYEQRRQDIRRAEAETLLRLSRALGCNALDLFE